MTMRIGLVIDIESDEESDEDSDQMEEEESYDWEEGVFETLTIEESYNNDEGSSLPTCENQTLLPPSLQVREKSKETSSVLNFEGFKNKDGW